MGKEDYVSTGGALKLKGVSSGKVEKKKKKKKSSSSKAVTDGSSSNAVATGGDAAATDLESKETLATKPAEEDKTKEKEKIQYAGKTEAEKRFLERKEKQRQERLKREGLKSHKERVEEFNKYLSNLSEHHDMPRIGPG